MCLQSCSYFTSFTFPLKLALKNSDTVAGNIYAMFKVVGCDSLLFSVYFLSLYCPLLALTEIRYRVLACPR